MTEINPTFEGYQKLRESIEFVEQVGNIYPVNQVDVTVQYEHYGEREVTGTLLSVRKSLNQDGEERENQRYNGWFGKVLLPTGMLNIYADPDTGGETVIFVPDWEGKGGKRYKRPIKSIEIEENGEKEPTCPECGEEMTFGWLENAPDDHPGTSNGWICKKRIAGLGRLTEYPVGKLP